MSDVNQAENEDSNESDIVYAGFWVRMLASVIDSILGVVLFAAIGMAVYGSLFPEVSGESTSFSNIVTSYILPFLITIIFWIYRSATPGKMILDLVIVDSTTFEKPSNGKLVLRYLCYYVSMLVLFLGFFWIGWDKKKQGWHDKIAGTLVVQRD